MTEFTLGNYRLAVDVEATRAYYTAHHESWITCQCTATGKRRWPTVSLPRPRRV